MQETICSGLKSLTPQSGKQKRMADGFKSLAIYKVGFSEYPMRPHARVLHGVDLKVSSSSLFRLVLLFLGPVDNVNTRVVDLARVSTYLSSSLSWAHPVAERVPPMIAINARTRLRPNATSSPRSRQGPGQLGFTLHGPGGT